MFEWFNKHKKDVMTYTLWLIIPSFIFLYGYGECAKPAVYRWVVKVNGEEVTERDWSSRIDSLRNQYRQYGREATYDELAAQALDSVIVATLYRHKADTFGIQTTNSEVLTSIKASEYFQDESGQFSKARFDTIMFNAGIHPIAYEEQQRESLTQTKMFSLLRTSVYPAASEIKREEALSTKTVNLEYLAFEPSSYVKDVTPDEEGLNAFFEENKESYRIPEQRRIAWAKFIPAPAVTGATFPETQLERFFNERKNKDYLIPDRVMVQHVLYEAKKFVDSATATEAEIQKHFEENGDQYMHPEKMRVRYIAQPLEALVAEQIVSEASIQAYYDENQRRYEHGEEAKASHVLLKVTPGLSPEDEKAIPARLSEIRQQIMDGTITFEEAAKTHSQGPSGPKGGDLGYFGRGRMIKPFEEVAFTLPLGQISEPLKTQFGYHLIHVVDRRDEGVSPLDDVRDTIHDMMKSQTAITDFKNRHAELKSLDELNEKYEIKTTDWFARKDKLAEIIGPDQFVFSAAAFVKNPRNPIISAGNRSSQNLYLIEQLGRVESTAMTLDEARDQVAKDVKEFNALDVAEQAALADLGRIKNASMTLDAIALERGFQSQQTNFFSRNEGFVIGFGSRPVALTTLAFTLTENETDGPVPSPAGFHLIRLVARDPSHAPEFEEVRNDVEKDFAQFRAETEARIEANKFGDKLFNDELTVETLAAQKNIEWGTTGLFGATGTIEEFGYQPMILRQIFQLDEENIVSDPLEIRPPNYSRSPKPLPVKAYYITELLETKEPYVPVLDEVREDAEDDYRLKLAEPIAVQRADEALAAIRAELASGQPFSASPARAVNLEAYDDPDSERDQAKGGAYRGPFDVSGGSALVGGIPGSAVPFTKTAVALPAGKVSAAVSVYKEKFDEDKNREQGLLTGVYIIQALEHKTTEIPATGTSPAKQTIQRLTQQIQPAVFQAWIEEVSAAATIIYNDKVLDPDAEEDEEALSSEEESEDQSS